MPHANAMTVAMMICALLVATVANHAAVAADIEVVREFTLEAGTQVRPRSVIRLPSGDFVIAGDIPGLGSGWATRIDENGNVKWRFVLPKQTPQSSVVFYGVANLFDDGVLLCGQSGQRPALLVRLDRSGVLLSKQELLPRFPEGGGRAVFEQCTNWRDELVAVATVFRTLGPVPRTAANVKFENSYWMVRLDASGTPISDQLFHTERGGNGVSSPLMILHDGGLAFSGIRAKLGGPSDTELFRFRLGGELVASRRLTGKYVVLPSLADDTRLFVLKDEQPGPLLFVYGISEVEPEFQRRFKSDPNFLATSHWLVNDTTLLLAGQTKASEARPPNAALAILEVNERPKILELAPMFSSSRVDVIAPASVRGEFMVIRRFTANDRSTAVLVALIRVR